MNNQDRTSNDRSAPDNSRRMAPAGMEHLFLRELNKSDVFDRPDGQPLSLQTFGAVRETCPHCVGRHLRLILRQESVRLAHLFCDHCETCFDARYANGRCALTI
jgi:hypothetical protein